MVRLSKPESAGSVPESGIQVHACCNVAQQSARCMGLFFYYAILGDAQALRQTVQLGRDCARGDVSTAVNALAEDASSSLFRKLHLWKFILGKMGAVSLGSLDDAVQGLLAQGRVQLLLGDLPRTIIVPEPLVPVLTMAILMAGEGLARGGTVRLSCPSANICHLTLDGSHIAWPPSVLRAITQAALPDDPAAREALAICLVAEAENVGVTVFIVGSDPVSTPGIHLFLPPGLEISELQKPQEPDADTAVERHFLDNAIVPPKPPESE